MQSKYKTSNEFALKHRESYVKRIYGLAWSVYLNMYKQQDGKCAICSKNISIFSLRDITTSAQVDHDHSTKEVRGLLCHRCNCGLGNFNDNIELMERAKQYLEVFSHR